LSERKIVDYNIAVYMVDLTVLKSEYSKEIDAMRYIMGEKSPLLLRRHAQRARAQLRQMQRQLTMIEVLAAELAASPPPPKLKLVDKDAE
jgi:hypothetical protein